MRDRATKHFNRILVAYETLNNPRKRIVYDKLGVEGLKLKTWQLGVRSMSPEQFKYWFEENMQKQKMESLDELVGSTGKVQALVDISGFWFSNLVRHVDEKGNLLRVEVKPYPTGRVSSYAVRHSFHVPLHAIAELLERPLDELWKQNEEKPTQPQSNENHRLPKPMLSFEFGINGRSIVVARQKGSPKQKAEAKLPSQVLGGTSLAATLSHHFPHVSPETPRSLASLMAGNQIGLTAIAFPTPMITTHIGRTFGQNAAQVQGSFFALPSKAPPLITTTFNRRLGIRHSMFIGFNTGATQWWYTSLKDLFSFPAPGKLRSGYASLGYTYHPMATGYPEGEEGDASQQPRQKAGKSQRTETYSAVLTAGTMAGGAQIKLAWGRTFFVGTPISKAAHGQKRPSVGVRLGVETTLHVTGSARWLVKASRKIFDNTTVGVNISVGGASGTEGVVVGFTWTRLGQKIALPFMIAPIPDHRMAVYATVVPFFTYVVAEFLWLRPRERQLREQEAARIWKAMKKKILRRRKAAEDAQEVMRVSVERKMEQERNSNGLVILRATYGKQGMLADVTIALAALVDHGQLVLPSGVDKSKLIGFWDPAPGSEKLLTVSYLYGGLGHEVVVKSSHGLAAPMRSHTLPGQV
jgi:DnaJ family protein C protein 11